MILKRRAAMLLAATISLTSVSSITTIPTHAISINKVNNVIQVEAGKVVGIGLDGAFTSSHSAHTLVIDPTDGLKVGDKIVLDIKNGKWVDNTTLNTALSKTTSSAIDVNGANYFYTNTTDTQGKVEWSFKVVRESDVRMTATVVKAPYDLTAQNPVSRKKFEIPLAYIPNNGVMSVEVSGGTLTEDIQIISKTGYNNEILKLTNQNIPKIHKNGKIADIVVREEMPGHFKMLSDMGGVIQFKLDKPGYKFIGSPTIKYLDGLTGTESAVGVKNDISDNSIINVTLPNLYTTSVGEFIISGLQVENKDNTPSNDDLYIVSSGVGTNNQKLKVASAEDYGIDISVDYSKSKKNIYTGKYEDIQLVIQEKITGSLVSGDRIELELDNGYFGVYDEDSKKDEEDQLASMLKLPSGFEVIDYEMDDDDRFNGCTIKIDKIDNNNINKFELDLEVYAPFNYDDDAITLHVKTSRYGRERFNLFRIRDAYNVDTKLNVLKAGYKSQKVNDITISEEDNGVLSKGSEIIIDLDSLPSGVLLSDDSEIDVVVESGDIRLGDAKINKASRTVTIPVTKASKKESEIVINGISLDVKKSTPAKSYSIVITGDAFGDGIEFEEKCIQIINQAPPVDPIRTGVVEFRVGYKAYAYNGKAFNMDASPFLHDGNTMVPIRYLTEAFGIAGSALQYDKGVATITIGNDILRLRDGSSVANYKGQDRPMGGKVMVKDNRTYVPMGEIGRILNLVVEWDNTLKVAKFTKK